MPEIKVGGSENAAFILVIVATLVLVAAAWWWQSSDLARLRATHTGLVSEQTQLADTTAQVRDLEDRRAVVDQKLGIIVDLKKSQSGPVLLLDQVSRELPDSLWLTDMTVSTGGIVTIIGQALSEFAISDFGLNLRLSSYFADTTIEFTTNTGDSTRFQLSTRFVPLSVAEEEEAADPTTDPAAGAGR